MGNRNTNTTGYIHNDEPNINDLTKAMRYNNLGEPVVRVSGSYVNEGIVIANNDLDDGYSAIFKHGYHSTFTNGTEESYWDNGGAYPWAAWATPGAVTLSSTLGDTGSLIVEGLDENFAPQTVTYTLTGPTPIATSESWARIHNMMYNDSVSSNSGTITAVIDSTVVAQIEAGNGSTQMAQYTVPAGYTAYVMQGTANIGKGNDGEGAFKYRLFGGSFRVAMFFQLYQTTFEYKFTTPLKLPEKTDLDVTLTASNANTPSAAMYDIILVQNT